MSEHESKEQETVYEVEFARWFGPRLGYNDSGESEQKSKEGVHAGFLTVVDEERIDSYDEATEDSWERRFGTPLAEGQVNEADGSDTHDDRETANGEWAAAGD